MSENNFYCSQKFTWLSINLEKLQYMSCCAAKSKKIDLNFVRSNPGSLFNNPDLIKERQDMLQDIPVASCEASCWIPESKNIISRRLKSNTNIRTHETEISEPEILHLLVTSNCNMTCVYCCKQYSSSWLQDISNKPYNVVTSDDKFVINDTERVLQNLSQKDLGKSSVNQLLLDEFDKLSKSQSLRKVEITGGEPFLYLYLLDIVQSVPADKAVEIYTGLGVNPKRFEKICSMLSEYSNVQIVISAETVEDLYEFCRYGNTWEQFQTNLNTLTKYNIHTSFNATLSNLTLFGYGEFVKRFKDYDVQYSPCTDPGFMAMHVMDDDSKNIILDQLDVLNIESFEFIANSLKVEPYISECANLRSYLLDFAERRNLKLDVFPKSFVNWVVQ